MSFEIIKSEEPKRKVNEKERKNNLCTYGPSLKEMSYASFESWKENVGELGQKSYLKK